MKYTYIRTLVSSTVLAAIASTISHAAGFSLYTESNGYSVGNFGAGVAAEARDASTAWYNPAGLVLIKEQQAVLGGVGVFPATIISGNTSYITPIFGIPLPAYNQSFSDLNGAESAFVPSFHYARPLGENATFGFSVVAPFGLSTLWDSTDPVRYAAEKTELIVMDISPSIGGKLTEYVFIGAGIDLQYAKVKFNSYLGSPALLNALDRNPRELDSLSYNKGHSTAVGFHAGGMIVFNDNHTRVGLNYQSKFKHKFNGYSELSGPLASTATNIFLTPVDGKFRVNNLQSNRIELPEVVTLSGYHDVNPRIAILGSVVYTSWNSIKTLELKNVAVGSPNPLTFFINNVTVNSTSVENYRNTWRWALGANVQVNEQWLLRIGGGYDETPTKDQFRTVRLPDANRWALSAGAHYQYRSDLGFDIGYNYIWGDARMPINKTQEIGTSSFNVNATIKAYAHIVGAQVTWKMDGVDEKPAMKK